MTWAKVSVSATSKLLSPPTAWPLHMNMRGLFQPGDDGGPATSDQLLFAMVLGGNVLSPLALGLTPIPVTHLVKFSAILAAVNSSGGPGAGFIPIPA